MGISLRKRAGSLWHRLLSSLVVCKLPGSLFPADYTIRPVAATRDLDAVASLGAALSDSRREPMREAFHQEFACQDPRRWLFLVAVEERKGGKVLGFVRAMRQGPDGGWWISGLGVRPFYRGRGIGEALMRAALARLRAAGVREVHLVVNRASRPAIALYRKLGFVQEPQPAEASQEDDSLRMILDLARENQIQ